MIFCEFLFSHIFFEGFVYRAGERGGCYYGIGRFVGWLRVGCAISGGGTVR